MEFLISHDSDGVYVYTATISSVIPDSHLSNNSFTVFSTVDTIAPDTFITFAASFAVDSATATFEFSANEDSTFECSIDDGITIEDFAPCTSPYTRSNFVQGEHIFYVRAVDVQGNTDQTPATKTWIIADSEEIVSVTPADGDINVATDATIVVTFAQPVLLDITIATGPCDGV